MADKQEYSEEERQAWRAAWRARRQERRAKQRLANVDRAKAMHGARMAAEKLKSPLAVRKSGRRTRPGEGVRSPQFFIGCSGWYYWHWGGAFYPDDLPRSEWFAHYANKFNTVELNAPFYSWPTLANVRTWLKQAGRKRFVYTIKGCELITHVKRFRGTKTLVRDFGYIADVLGPHMGCFLFQLPPSLHYSRSLLRRIVEQLDPSRRPEGEQSILRKNVVEFRHKSWWNSAVYWAFEKAGVIFCSTSGPRLPDELIKTSDDIYIRFHGTKRWYRHDYSRAELQIWADRIKASGAKRVWAYFNNDREGFAIKNARMLRRLLKAF
jgi:uncharacterized protein YecE (DUF72 family)